MSERKFASTTIRDSEDKLGLTPQQVAELLAKANESAAVTDKFGTDISGGLISSIIIYLRDLASMIETAGLSGIQGELNDNPAFWAGGTHADALAVTSFLRKIANGQTPAVGEYAALAKIALLHSGAAKVGDLIVEESGRIIMVDPVTGKERIVFSLEDLPSIEDLVAGVSSTGNITIGSGSTTTRQTLSGTANVTVADGMGSMGKVTITVSGNGRKDSFGRSSFIEAKLVLYRGSTMVRTVWRSSVFFLSDSYQFESESITFDPMSVILSAKGNYHFKLEVEEAGDISSASATSTSFPFSWNASLQGVNRQQYSKDGMMFFYGLIHFYFSQSRGLIVGGPTDIPGLLGKGRVASNGSREGAKYWGAKNNAGAFVDKTTGSYKVPVNCPNGDYDVFITPRTANRTFIVGETTATYFYVYFRDLNGNLADSAFSYTMVGNNY